MPICYHCGEEAQTFHCEECGQEYCALHKDSINHDCNIVKETMNFSQTSSVSPSYVYVPRTSPTIQDQINQRQQPPQYLQEQTSSSGYPGTAVRGTTDGSFTWYRQEKAIPENAFDPDSGIEFKGILWSHKSEFTHLLIGSALIFVIGLMGFWNQQLIDLDLGWAIFMLAGFYTTAFLFHEFGHREVARHFKLQTKFRLLSFGMILTVAGLSMSLISLIGGLGSLPSLALPGAVVVLGLEKVDRKTGLCKAAGPIVNLVYGMILLIVSFIIPTSLYPLNMFIGVAAALNFTLGLFNMIPIGILDGQNIFKWNKPLYLILFTSLLLSLIITYANIYAPLAVNLYIPEEWRAAL